MCTAIILMTIAVLLAFGPMALIGIIAAFAWFSSDGLMAIIITIFWLVTADHSWSTFHTFSSGTAVTIIGLYILGTTVSIYNQS